MLAARSESPGTTCATTGRATPPRPADAWVRLLPRSRRDLAADPPRRSVQHPGIAIVGQRASAGRIRGTCGHRRTRLRGDLHRAGTPGQRRPDRHPFRPHHVPLNSAASWSPSTPSRHHRPAFQGSGRSDEPGCGQAVVLHPSVGDGDAAARGSSDRRRSGVGLECSGIDEPVTVVADLGQHRLRSGRQGRRRPGRSVSTRAAGSAARWGRRCVARRHSAALGPGPRWPGRGRYRPALGRAHHPLNRRAVCGSIRIRFGVRAESCCGLVGRNELSRRRGGSRA
jgi:hypothetical protein